MGLNEARERFREMLPSALRDAHVAALEDDARAELLDIKAGVLAAFEEAAPKPPPPVRIQRVDECVGPGKYVTTYEVVDTRKAGKARIIGVCRTREEAEARWEKAYLIPVEGGGFVRPIGGAAYTYAAVDSDEYWHDTDVETIASTDKYGVITGCALTADAANMTVDLGAGTILHNGSAVAVAAATDAYTVVADGSNERWAALCISSAGAAVLVSGDPAASAASEPAKPEIGDRVCSGMYKVQAAQTVAANCEYQLDKRMILRGPFTVILSSDFNNTQSNTTLENVTGVSFPLAANVRYAFEALVVYRSGTTPDFKAAFTVPAGATVHYKSVATGATASEPTTASLVINASAGTVAAEGDSADRSIMFFGHVSNGSTAGNLQLQSAQSTSDASATTTKAGTWLRVALN